MKKFTAVSLIAFLINANLFAGTSIISDLDDTIKITNSGNLIKAFFYGAAKRKVYLGMPEFLESSRDYVSEVSVVTASPRMLKYNVRRLIRRHDLQIENVVLNRNINRPTKFNFKLNAIKNILDNSSDDFILMGDDVGEDPEIYDEVMKLYPDRILANYIHVIRNRELPASAIKYWTTFELSVREYESGRLSEESVYKMADVFQHEKNYKWVFPEFAHCPKEKAPFEWLFKTRFEDVSRMLVNRMKHYCRFEWDD